MKWNFHISGPTEGTVLPTEVKAATIRFVSELRQAGLPAPAFAELTLDGKTTDIVAEVAATANAGGAG